MPFHTPPTWKALYLRHFQASVYIPLDSFQTREKIMFIQTLTFIPISSHILKNPSFSKHIWNALYPFIFLPWDIFKIKNKWYADQNCTDASWFQIMTGRCLLSKFQYLLFNFALMEGILATFPLLPHEENLSKSDCIPVAKLTAQFVHYVNLGREIRKFS